MFKVLTNGGRIQLRFWNESPVRANFKRLFGATRIGRASNALSSSSHSLWVQFWTKTGIVLRRRKNYRWYLVLCVGISGYLFGHKFASYPRDLYMRPTSKHPSLQMLFDYSVASVAHSKNEEKYRYAISELIDSSHEARGKSLDVLDLLVLGQHASQARDEEISYHAYMMAHYLDSDNVGGNSALQFSTYKEDAKQRD